MTLQEAKVYVQQQVTANYEFPLDIISCSHDVLDENSVSINSEGITADECDTIISDVWNRMQ